MTGVGVERAEGLSQRASGRAVHRVAGLWAIQDHRRDRACVLDAHGGRSRLTGRQRLLLTREEALLGAPNGEKGQCSQDGKDRAQEVAGQEPEHHPSRRRCRRDPKR